MSHIFTKTLGEIRPGRLFAMVNYTGAYMRITFGSDQLGANEDPGGHVPIVEIATGVVIFMSKVKPCYCFPGETMT